MALVKVVRDNLLSGANLQKLEVGAQVSVSGDVAKRWVAAGLVEIISDDDQVLEVATPGDAAEQAEQAEQQEESASKSKKAK
ncbi:hypothetical protein [Klebsiella pneumoniae]|uniref:hypothetical protein n=1 Tax=Klebsiella pneumoniae TaxID=573 RepID=UPI00050C8ABC|nr:hypothetical protein [Klebsiella pneumoniae]HDZ9786471.1 hypothetical protein [Klebsiella variicola subsp. variicola]EKW8561219.1 hypothetical protein [Klebsiella pneumoniae]EMC2599664.1 hypothetical protein [Klebsiella pneumoniae]KAB7974110.1 hypothetical protein GCK80_25185 [Klebsiella pneumoniae]KAB7975497.1 hypothetical protein GCK90_25490 [Klebsiella pneumoniae]